MDHHGAVQRSNSDSKSGDYKSPEYRRDIQIVQKKDISVRTWVFSSTSRKGSLEGGRLAEKI